MNNKNSSKGMLAIMFASAFIGGFNENLVNMALVSIMADFNIDSVTAQWLVTGYMVLSTVVVMCMAFLFRRVKLRLLFAIGIVFSFFGSILGYISNSFEMLMIARLVQAVGTGIFIPMMMNVIVVVAPKNKMGRYMSIGSCMITFGPALAPVLCGFLVTMAGWHSIFLIPAATLVIVGLAGMFLVTNLETQKIKLDAVSVALTPIFLTSLCSFLAYMTTSFYIAIVSAILCLVSAILFVVRQFKVDNPLINMTPMKQKSFWPSILVNVIAMTGVFSMSVLLPVYFESAISMSAMQAGIVMLIPVLCNCGGSLLGGRIFDRFGAWPLLPAGYFLVMIGFAAMALYAGQLSLLIMVVAAMFVYGFTGLIFSPAQSAGLRTLTPELSAHGVALTTTFVQIAACIGPSLYTGLLSFGQEMSLSSGASVQVSVGDGFSLAMTIASILAICGTLVAFFYSRTLTKDNEQSTTTIEEAPQVKPSIDAVIVSDPYVVKTSDTVKHVLDLMLVNRTGGVCVVDEEENVWGFLSDGDIMRYLSETHPMVTSVYSLVEMRDSLTFNERLKEMLERRVDEIATQGVISLELGSTLERACTVMGERKLKKVPVISNGKVVGTVNRSDILRYALGLNI